MKLARRAVSVAHATTNSDAFGAIMLHGWVDDSKTPICCPPEPGAPTGLLDGAQLHARWCRVCDGKLVRAYWSVTSFARQRLWVASIGERDEATAQGTAATDVDAYVAASAAIAKMVGKTVAVIITQSGEASALKVARERRAQARHAKVSDGTGAQIVEHVFFHEKYFTDWFSRSFQWKTTRAKVLRKTAKRLFVEDTRGTYYLPTGATVLKTFALDRAELAKGECRGWTLDPNPPGTERGEQPGWATVLNVDATCSLRDSKSAFRRAAKTAHPDHGGTAEAFQRVKSAFDAAMGAFQ